MPASFRAVIWLFKAGLLLPCGVAPNPRAIGLLSRVAVALTMPCSANRRKLVTPAAGLLGGGQGLIRPLQQFIGLLAVQRIHR